MIVGAVNVVDSVLVDINKSLTLAALHIVVM